MNLKVLTNKLNVITRQALESAVSSAVSRTHFEIEVEHILLELLIRPDSDCVAILKALGIEIVPLEKALRQGLDRLRTGNPRHPVFSVHVPRWLTSAWVMGSLEYGASQLRSGFLLAVLMTDQELRRRLGTSLEWLERLPVDKLEDNLLPILRRTKEHENASSANDSASAEPTAPSPTPSLDRFTVDLTAQARKGSLDPVLGRDGEIRQMIDILLRRRQNNPILTGEPGVGKTAVVEGLAQLIAKGEVPGPLKSVALRVLDLGLLQAGASVKGEFENRLRSVMDEVKASLSPIILFIDEAHTMIGAGGQAGQSDAANLLKPALARGELRTIAATTWSEYKKYFEKDAALARRFQVVKVEEPSEEDAIQMMRGVALAMEGHHQVRILDEAVVASVKLSSRYLSGRQLPDKCVSVLDTACARVALSRAALPAEIQALMRQRDNVDREKAALEREPEEAAHLARMEALSQTRQTLEENLRKQQEAFAYQTELVKRIECARGKHASHGEIEVDREAQRLLRAAHKAHPLVYECVNGSVIGEVIAGWTGIPLGRMVADELDAVRQLANLLGERVLGQEHALQTLARSLQIAKSGLEDPSKPKGVFLLLGPSGVGKTETALALADALYGGERHLVSINLSEYQEAHTVSALKGSPPGYVGYGEGGVLTEAVRRHPYSVVLLDEVEKAHPDVLELFYQVFDKGRLEDAEGREVDFRNTVILLTANVGADLILRAVAHGVTVDGVSRPPTPDDLLELVRPLCLKTFKAAFLGRLTIVPYFPVQDAVLKNIIRLKLTRLAHRMQESHGATLHYDEALLDLLVERCTDVESGARNADAIITHLILGELSDQVLAALANGQRIQSAHLHLEAEHVSVSLTTEAKNP